MMTAYNFDDRNIHWSKLGDFLHFVYAVLDVDVKLEIDDLLLKYDPWLFKHQAFWGVPHRTGGGKEMECGLYSVCGNDDILFELFDDDLNETPTLSMED